MPKAKAYRPYLSAPDVQYILDVLAAHEGNDPSSTAKKLYLLNVKIKSEMVTPAYELKGRKTLLDSLGGGSMGDSVERITTIGISRDAITDGVEYIDPAVKRKIAYDKFMADAEGCTAEELALAETYKWENEL